MDKTFTDQQLLSLLVEGDKNAFDSIYRKYWHELYTDAYRRLKNALQAEDIVQDVFIKFWQRRAELQIDNLPAYLHTAVRYRIYNYIARDAVNDAFYRPFDAIASYSEEPDAVVLEKELLTLINAYIDALPKKRRLIFSLHFHENLSTAEIARELNISQKTVQNQLNTAMTGLRATILPLLILSLMLGGFPH